MGLFKSSEKKGGKSILPKLPELPSLGSFEESGGESSEIHVLPSFPTNPLGEKFSQDTIKNAVLGEDNPGDYPEISLPEKPALLKSIIPSEDKTQIGAIPSNQIVPQLEELQRPIEKTGSPKHVEDKSFLPGPIFVRIDKFEDSLKILESSKKKIKEMEDLLRETRALKQKEEEELSSWEAEIDQLKKQLEKVDRDIFAKIE